MTILIIFLSLGSVSGSCSPSCIASANITGLSCNEETGHCLYGCENNYDGDRCDRCERGKTGDQCQYHCNYNCQNCTWDISGGVGCDLCLPGYYYFNKGCNLCLSSCTTNIHSDLPTCDPVDGSCTFGCTQNWYGDQCNLHCGILCLNRTCTRHDGCCTEGCRYDTYGGCNCQTPCSSYCEGGTCHQNHTCIQSCKANHWGPDCAETCSENCLDTPNSSASVCDRTGICIYGCKKTYRGLRCSERCSETCVERDCDPDSEVCSQGCTKGHYGQHCNFTCSSACPNKSCFRNDGTCTNNCTAGYFGPFCSRRCPDNCLNRRCGRQDGLCSEGCLRGLTGDRCSTVLGSKHIQEDARSLKLILDPIFYTVAGIIVLGMTLVVLVIYRKKSMSWRLKKGDNANTVANFNVSEQNMQLSSSLQTPFDDRSKQGPNTHEALHQDDTFVGQPPYVNLAEDYLHSIPINDGTSPVTHVYQTLQRDGDTDEHHYGDVACEAAGISPVDIIDDSVNKYQDIEQNVHPERAHLGMTYNNTEDAARGSMEYENMKFNK